MTAMTPGSNIPLPVSRVAVDVAAPVRLDVSGLLLTGDGKVRSDDDFIFYNQPAGPGVTYRSGGGTSPDAITVDTSAVPPGIEKIVVTASPDAAGQTFQGIEPTATIRNADDGSVLGTFTPPRLGTETALVVVEIYLRNGAWKARAVGQGYADGLAGLATDFGVDIDDDAAPHEALGGPAEEEPAVPGTPEPVDSDAAVPNLDGVPTPRPPADDAATQRPAARPRTAKKKITLPKAAGRSLAENESWREARLFPVTALKSDRDRETRATSVLLSVMAQVPEFGRRLMAGFGAPAGRMETYAEVSLPHGDTP
ncbi:TerD family protein, partial [Streptomyces sp. NPDC048279]|uniref:TerD family protein n=1 Tax=Streptomyces sp. NPDC048279 TaxID=3154714 RepID=UPI0034306A73